MCHLTNFFSTVTLNLKHSHILPALNCISAEHHIILLMPVKKKHSQMSLYWPTHLTRLTAGDGYRTCDLSATASSTISPALNWTRPVPESAPQPGLIGIPAVKEAFIILLSSGLIFPLPPSHIIINTL